MDLNTLLLWFVAAAGLLMLYRAGRARRGGWVVVALLVLGATGGALAVRPSLAGYVGGGLLAVLVVAPLTGYRRLFHHTVRGEYGKARRLAAALRVLHPADGWRELPRLLEALESGRPEAVAEAAAEREADRSGQTGVGRLGVALLYRLHNQWKELQDWLHANLSPAELARDPNMLALMLRTYGELGDPQGLLRTYGQFDAAIRSMGLGIYRNMCRLFVFAFCGRRDVVARLFDGPLALYPQGVQRFWLATAQMAAGRAEEARQELEAARDEADALTRAGIERRLEWPLPAADEALGPEARQQLAAIEDELDQEERYSPRQVLLRGRAHVTEVLLAINVAVFVLELVHGGSTDPLTLYRLGALDTHAVAEGQWWRLAASTFLHYGWLHLAVNMAALLLLGPFVEFALGWWRFLVTYLASGIGSMGGIVVLGQWLGWEAQFVVGASGAIMGLIGATGAVLLRGWARERAQVARRRLGFVVFVVLFQVVFDLSTPEVSFHAHFGGVVVGFAVASLLRHHVGGRGEA
ncbi:MAG: rhomboid family intramembrane serine protease [Candidatus Brocadiia bacterium]